MIWFVFLDSNNLVASAGRATTLPPGAVAVPNYPGTLEGLSRMVMTGQQLVSRPLSAAVQSQGHQHTLSNMPLGTVVTVYDATGRELLVEFTTTTEGESETIDLPDPGTYDISAVAPLPALPLTLQVTT
ncbi:MAG: hypothetical protein AAFO86_12430 [Pseudomonadota bacterium]